MSDIDVFNRQRQCEQDCNATYTALAKGLERLQGLGVIDVAQLVKALTAGGIACRECVDTCVPQTRHFDDDRSVTL
jgi:hypothetical protein